LLQYSRSEESLEAQLKLLRQKQDQLHVVSPIDGEVITWQVRDRLLTRPVEKGQLLLTVADPKGKWDLEIHMPEDRMGHIARARNALHSDAEHAKDDLSVSYILATNPGVSRKGTVTDVQSIAEVRGEEGNVVLVRVAIDKDDLAADEIRPGATVNAKVDCGWASVGYVWFHDAISFVQSRILFRL
jgi:multidrug efflux pump subunit AcrA (membrane-fusion protein)